MTGSKRALCREKWHRISETELISTTRSSVSASPGVPAKQEQSIDLDEDVPENTMAIKQHPLSGDILELTRKRQLKKRTCVTVIAWIGVGVVQFFSGLAAYLFLARKKSN